MVPLIGIYLTASMSLTSLSIILTVLVLQLHHSGQFAPKMPRNFYNFMTKKIANFVCMSDTVRRYEESKAQLGIIKSDESKSEDMNDMNKQKEAFKSTLIDCEKNFNFLNYDLSNTIKKNTGSENMLCLSCLCCCFKSTELNENKISSNEVLRSCDFDSEVRLFRGNYKKNSIASYTNKENNLHSIKIINHENKINYDILEENEDVLIESHNKARIKKYENKAHIIDNSLFNNRKSTKDLSECYKDPHQLAYSAHISQESSNKAQFAIPFNLVAYKNELKANLAKQKSASATKSNRHCAKCMSSSCKRGSSDAFGEISSTLKEFIKKQDVIATSNSLQNEWKLIALIADRVLFWIFSVSIFIVSIVLLVIVPVIKNRELINSIANKP